jgi:HEAT repeat protein
MRHVFISYSRREDADFAKILEDEIGKAGFATWRDRSIAAGGEWRKEIDDALRDSFAIALVFSPQAKVSTYVNYEWAFALGAGIPVVTLLKGLTEQNLPQRLSLYQCLDFSRPDERPWQVLHSSLREFAEAQRSFTVRVPREAPPVVQEAARSLDSMDASEREAALASLGQMDHPAVVEVLSGAVQHPIRDVRFSAAVHLAEHRDARALPALLEALRIGSRKVEEWMLSCIGKTAIPGLIVALGDENAGVRGAAASALGQIGGSEAVAALIECSQHPHTWTRRRVLRALGDTRDPAALPALRAAASDTDEDIRGAVASRLANCGGTAAIPDLIRLLDDPSRDVRNITVCALEELRDGAAIPALVKALDDEYDQAARNAAVALQKIGDPQVIPALIHSARSKKDMPSGIEEALKSFGDACRPELQKALHDEHPHVRAMAIGLLSALADESDLPEFFEALSDPSARVRRYAIRAMNKGAHPDLVPRLIELLRDENEYVCKEAVYKLQNIGDPAAIPHLIECLQDDGLAEAAAYALESSGTRPALNAARAWRKQQK